MNNLIEIVNTILLSEDAVRLLGIKILDSDDFIELILRFLLNTGVILFLVRYLYYSVTKRKDYLFTYILISTTIFFLCFLLESVKLELGFAFGLFAIFGIIRYRTTTIPIKEMTYLFVTIGISVINALSNKKVSYAELVLTNLVVIFIVWGLEKFWLLRHEATKTIVYEKIQLIQPENEALLINDLENRLGIKINRIEIGNVNFLRDSADIKIYYYNDYQFNKVDEYGNE
jgi:Domain of unknown function (DUF4956)